MPDIYDSSGKKIGHLDQGNGGFGCVILGIFLIIAGYYSLKKWIVHEWEARDDFRAKVIVQASATVWEGPDHFDCIIPIGIEVVVTSSTDNGQCEIWVQGDKLKCSKSTRLNKYDSYKSFIQCEKLEKIPDEGD